MANCKDSACGKHQGYIYVDEPQAGMWPAFLVLILAAACIQSIQPFNLSPSPSSPSSFRLTSISETLSSVEILASIKETKRGINADAAKQEDIASWIRSRGKKAVRSDLLLGNYEVSYVGVGDNQKGQGNPAGGNYRGRIGSFFYSTKGLYQHLLPPDGAFVCCLSLCLSVSYHLFTSYSPLK